MVVLVLAMTGALVSGMKHIGRAAAADVSRHARVVFAVYSDDAGDTRGYRDFEAFAAALRHVDAELASRVSLEFVQVSVAGGESIDRALQRIARTGPAAIIATCDDVLDAAQRQAGDIPVVFASHADPVAAGYVRSIAAPGVPRTGFTYHLPLTQKMVEILASAYPGVRRVGIVTDRLRADSPGFTEDVHAVERALGLEVSVFIAATTDDLERVLRSRAGADVDAWYVPVGEVLWNDEAAVLELMERSGRPVLYERTRLARRAGALAYEPRVADPFSILASQLTLVLHGADPASIPVERPSEFELSINLSSAGMGSRIPSKSFVKRANKLFLPDVSPWS